MDIFVVAFLTVSTIRLPISMSLAEVIGIYRSFLVCVTTPTKTLILGRMEYAIKFKSFALD